MKVQFIHNGDFNGGPNVIAEVVVTEAPTQEQCEKIEKEIDKIISKWEEKDEIDEEELTDDLTYMCYAAARKYLKLGDNTVIKTFYV